MAFGQEISILGLKPKWEKDLRRSLGNIKDSADFIQQLTDWEVSMRKRGFRELGRQQNTFKPPIVSWHQGPLYVVKTLEIDSLSQQYIRKAGLEEYQEKLKPYYWEQIKSGFNSIIEQYQNQGFPLASFERSKLEYSPKGKDSILTHLSYVFHRGPKIMIDSVVIEGDHREKDEFIQALTRVAPGELFNQKHIQDIPRILNNSIYFEETPAPKVTFTPWNTAQVYLKLKKKRAGKLDGLIGFLPPENENQKLRVTGQADIVLVSPFRLGETIRFFFNQFSPASQQLDIETTFPFVLRTPLRVDGSLHLLRQDSAFLNRSFEAAASYVFSPNLFARFFVRNRQSTLIDVSRIDPDTLTQLGGSYTLVGAGWHYEKLDYRLNPGRGLYIDAKAGIGNRKLRRNPQLPEELYEGKAESQQIREFELDLDSYFSLAPRHVIHLGNQTYWLDQDEYFTNDLRQLGGARTLRGFNENEFFSNFYTIFTAEYRLKLERDSFLFLFGDFAYVENQIRSRFERPTGFGLGMNYGTKAGIISISYAIGNRGGDDQYTAGRGKIHIGLVNQF